MALIDFKPTLHNDISIEDEELYNQYNNLINENKYGEAQQLLSDNQMDVMNVSLFNSWEKKILTLMQMVKEFYEPYCYKKTEPTAEEMKGKVIWEQEYE